MGVSHLFKLDGPSCMALVEVSSIDMFPLQLWQRMLPPLAMGTVWALAWERWLWVAVLLPGMPWQVEKMEVTEVITPTRHGRR